MTNKAIYIPRDEAKKNLKFEFSIMLMIFDRFGYVGSQEWLFSALYLGVPTLSVLVPTLSVLVPTLSVLVYGRCLAQPEELKGFEVFGNMNVVLSPILQMLEGLTNLRLSLAYQYCSWIQVTILNYILSTFWEL